MWQEKVDLLKTVPGVGDQTAGHWWGGSVGARYVFARQQIAALVGVASLNRDSGTLRGQRMTWGGRAVVRQALYMAALRASRCNPTIRAYYQRLRQAGKKAKVALVAWVRA